MEEFKDGKLIISYALSSPCSEPDVKILQKLWPLQSSEFLRKEKGQEFYMMYGASRAFKSWPTEAERKDLDQDVRRLGELIHENLIKISLTRAIVDQVLAEKR